MKQENYPIDFVVTWVNDKDEAWIKEKNHYLALAGIEVKPVAEDGRFRDFGFFKYWFRSIEKFAPWVRRVYLVLSDTNPVPEWLNERHPKLTIVRHSEIIEEKYLPTFSSHVIEWNLHKIKSLSSRFVYFNDDIYLCKPVSKGDFFRKGKPRDTFIMTAIEPKSMFTRILANNIYIVNRYFKKKAYIKKHLPLVYNLNYGRQLIKNFLLLPWPNFTGFQNLHIAPSLTVKGMERIWKLEKDLLEEVCSHRFRSEEDINIYLVSYFQVLSGYFCPRKVSDTARYEMQDYKWFEADLLKEKRKMMVLNDNEFPLDVDTAVESLLHAFETVFPEKCSYER